MAMDDKKAKEVLEGSENQEFNEGNLQSSGEHFQAAEKLRKSLGAVEQRIEFEEQRDEADRQMDTAAEVSKVINRTERNASEIKEAA